MDDLKLNDFPQSGFWKRLRRWVADHLKDCPKDDEHTHKCTHKLKDKENVRKEENFTKNTQNTLKTHWREKGMLK